MSIKICEFFSFLLQKHLCYTLENAGDPSFTLYYFVEGIKGEIWKYLCICSFEQKDTRKVIERLMKLATCKGWIERGWKGYKEWRK